MKSHTGIYLGSVAIILTCMVFLAFMATDTSTGDTSLSAVAMNWQHIGKLFSIYISDIELKIQLEQKNNSEFIY